MNKTPNVPNEIFLGKTEYSAWTDLKVNGWLFVATLISGAADIMFPHEVRQWPIALRTVVALIPFLALGFWARDLSRWIKGMDEMHRRITQAATLFAVSATFFLVLLWHRLEKAGLFQAGSSSGGDWDIATVGHVFLLLTCFYFAGCRIFTRRYE